MRLSERVRNIVIGIAAAVALGTYVYIEDRPAPPREKLLQKSPVVVTESMATESTESVEDTMTIGTGSKPEDKRRRERREQERP